MTNSSAIHNATIIVVECPRCLWKVPLRVEYYDEMFSGPIPLYSCPNCGGLSGNDSVVVSVD